jgi:hypothetical protein
MGAVYFEIAVASWNGTTSAVLSYVTAPSLAFIGDCEFRAPAFLRSSAVPDYRAYIISLEGHFLGAEILSECADDEAAEKAAQKLTSNHNVELWDRDRLVIRFLSEKK